MKKRYYAVGSAVFLALFLLLTRKREPVIEEIVWIEGGDLINPPSKKKALEVVDLKEDKKPEKVLTNPEKEVGITTTGSGVSTATADKAGNNKVTSLVTSAEGGIRTDAKSDETVAVLNEVRDLKNILTGGKPEKKEVGAVTTVSENVSNGGGSASVSNDKAGADVVEQPVGGSFAESLSGIDNGSAFDDFIDNERIRSEIENGVNPLDEPLLPEPDDFAHDLDNGEGEALEMAGMLSEMRRIQPVIAERESSPHDSLPSDFTEVELGKIKAELDGVKGLKEKILGVYGLAKHLRAQVEYNMDVLFSDRDMAVLRGLQEYCNEITNLVETSHLYTSGYLK